jgi:hypothetical protein
MGTFLHRDVAAVAPRVCLPPYRNPHDRETGHRIGDFRYLALYAFFSQGVTHAPLWATVATDRVCLARGHMPPV